MFWTNKCVAVLGGTGSLGSALIKKLLSYPVQKVVCFSRGEYLQFLMQQKYKDDKRLRFFIGDVRDRDRLTRALEGIDTVLHAAALKQITTAEYNPIEAVKTNVDGSMNVVEAAIDACVERVMGVSTDKACMPTNTYGATKKIMESLFMTGHVYAGSSPTMFSCVRYGNVVGSRGSVVKLFADQVRANIPVTVTHPESTRFLITIDQAVDFVLSSVEAMRGREIFVPKLKASTVQDIVDVICLKNHKVESIGLRQGEKMHEMLIPAGERVKDTKDRFVVHSTGKPLEKDYTSDSVPRLTRDEIRTYVHDSLFPPKD